MHIQGIAQKPSRHGTALNVPPRPALPQGCLPKDRPVLLLVSLPEGKVLGVAFLSDVFIRVIDPSPFPRPCLHPTKVQPGEFAVAGKFGGVEIERALAFVGVAPVCVCMCV